MSRLRQTKQQEQGSQLPIREEGVKPKKSVAPALDRSRRSPHNSDHK